MKALALVWLALVVVACGNSSGPGAQAASVTGIAGDSQVAPTGAALAFPLSLVTLGSNGQPVQGVNVTWSVTPSNGATFAPSASPSDVNGVASTNVTLGGTVADLVITATVPGISPVLFHERAIDPCTYLTAYTLGQTVNASLAATDCNRASLGWYYDYYGLDVPSAQQSVRISMSSTLFDSYLDLWSAAGPYVGFDDDIVPGLQQNSQLDVILPTGSYVIGANSYDKFSTGAYSITATARPAAMNGCREVWVARGITASDSITPTDCADSTAGTPHNYDVARMVVYGVTVLSIASRSAAINPSLALYRYNPAAPAATRRTLVASNDDSLPGTNTNAFIAYTVSDTAFYDIIIGSSAPGERGPYTFEVYASTTMSARRSEPAPGRREWWLSAGAPLKPSKL